MRQQNFLLKSKVKNNQKYISIKYTSIILDHSELNDIIHSKLAVKT